MERFKRILPWLVLLTPAALFLSTSLSQVLLYGGMVVWLVGVCRGELSFPKPKWTLFLLLYALWSILSALFSYQPLTSLYDLKELFLLLGVPFFLASIPEDERRERWTLRFLSGAVLFSSLYSLFQFLKGIGLSSSVRVVGFESHYMTQAGLMMMASLWGWVLFFREKRRLFLLLAIPSTVSLLLTLTRSAWLGFAAALVLWALLRRPKVALGVVAVLVVLFLFSPGPLKARLLSFTNWKDVTFQDRIVMAKKGVKMIQDKPLFGVGPNMVRYAYNVPRYVVHPGEKRNLHLHNNLLQIPAERGIPALLFWGGYVILLFMATWKVFRRGSPLAEASLVVIVAFLGAGLFEYNFGDYEVKTLFFFLTSLPFIEVNHESKR